MSAEMPSRRPRAVPLSPSHWLRTETHVAGSCRPEWRSFEGRHRMIFPRATLILLPCPVVAALCASFVDVRASPCLPSASAVRQEYPGAWPSWTMRTRGHEGEKCWYPATRGTAHDHRNESASAEATETGQPQSTPDARKRAALPASLAVLSNATEVTTPIVEEHSFADRFAAVGGDSRGPSSIIRFMIDPIGSGL